MSSPWPKPDEILEHYGRMREALTFLGRHFQEVTMNEKSRFFGLTRDEFDTCLTLTLDELDEQVVMMLMASCEATLKRDFARRLRDKRPKDQLWRQFRELEQATKDKDADHVRLEDLLDAWKRESGKIELIGQLKQLVKRRHWLAHGRHRTYKSGVAPDPTQAWAIIGAVFDALRQCQPDFPRA
ncbi:MAG TPA: hypothetical protein VLS89_01845 [Candidatus Nanopelagicales bacterium]|nr:hypothetical protein [Candidatus Nanopelagicales bacterium]